MPQCAAKTKEGVPCKNPVKKGQKYCRPHREQRMRRGIFSAFSIGAFSLGVLGFIANLTGILGYFGINPQIAPILTPTAWAYGTLSEPGTQANNIVRCTQTSDTIETIATSPNGKLFATLAIDGQVRIWQTSDGSLFHTLPKQAAPNIAANNSIAFSPDSKFIALSLASVDTVYVYIFEVDSAKLTKTLDHSLVTTSGTTLAWSANMVAFSPSGKVIAVGLNDGNVYLWNLDNDNFLNSFSHTGYGQDDNLQGIDAESVRIIVFLPDKNALMSVTNYAVRVWSLSDGSVRTTQELNLRNENSRSPSVAISPDAKELVTGGEGGTIRLWRLTDGHLINTLEGNLADVSSVAFSYDGKTIASGAWDHSIRLWDASKGKQLKLLQGPAPDGGQFYVTRIAFSPDGKFLFSATPSDQTLCIWDLQS